MQMIQNSWSPGVIFVLAFKA